MVVRLLLWTMDVRKKETMSKSQSVHATQSPPYNRACGWILENLHHRKRIRKSPPFDLRSGFVHME